MHASITAIALVVLLASLRSILLGRFGRAAAGEQRTLVLVLLQRTQWLVMLSLALAVGSRHLTLAPRVQRTIELATVIAVWTQIGLWASALLVHAIRVVLMRRGIQHLAREGGFIVVSFIAQAAVWITAFALALANAGVNVIALIAGLGTGSAALALAARGMLTNLFARASISFDQLFAVGDNLVTGDLQGKVEQISNRTTLLRSVNGEQIIIANADLLKTRLRNFGRIEERREVLTLRLQRSTPAATLREVVALIGETIRDEPMARFERCHFAEVTEDAMRIEAVYHARTGTPAGLAEVRDSIDARLHDAFARRSLIIGYATQRLHLVFG